MVIRIATAAPQLTSALQALRQHHIGQRQPDRRGVDRQARQRTLGNEAAS